MVGLPTMRSMLHSVGAACVVLFLVSARDAACRPDAEAEQRQQAEREKARGRFAQRIDAAIGALAPLTAGTAVASLAVRPLVEGDASGNDAAVLESALAQRFLSAGLLVYPCERERKIEVKYEAGRLPKGPLASVADLSALAAKGVTWLLVLRLVPDDLGASLHVELYDLRTRKKALKADVGPIPTRRFTMAEICGPDIVPPRNLRILQFAAEHFGRGVDRGECWDLPAVPIKADGGSVNGYAFGTEVPWQDGRAGDVITFGTNAETGGHVVLLLHWDADRSKATILHQNWGGNRTVMLAPLRDVERYKPGQALRLWRP